MPKFSLVPGHSKMQQVTVKFDASASVGNGDRSVVDPQKYPFRGSLPFCLSFAWGKVDQFQVMPIRVTKIESGNACRLLVPCGQGLRRVGDEASPYCLNSLVRLIHVGDHNGHVLEPVVVGSRIRGKRISPG